MLGDRTQVVEGQAISSYGVLDAKPVRPAFGGRLFEIHDLVEKPKLEDAPSNLAIIGRYILTPTIFEAFCRRSDQARAAKSSSPTACALLLKNEKIYGYVFEGTRHDAGDKLGFLKATVEFALKNPELGPDFAKYLRSLQVEEFAMNN